MSKYFVHSVKMKWHKKIKRKWKIEVRCRYLLRYPVSEIYGKFCYKVSLRVDEHNFIYTNIYFIPFSLSLSLTFSSCSLVFLSMVCYRNFPVIQLAGCVLRANQCQYRDFGVAAPIVVGDRRGIEIDPTCFRRDNRGTSRLSHVHRQRGEIAA